MTLAEISDISQTIAAIAVVVSLVYLAIQTRQAARNAKAAIHEDRVSTILGHIEQMITSDFYPVWSKVSRAEPGIPDSDIERYQLFASGVIMVWEERFRQKRDGMLDDDRWATSERTIALFTASPGFRAVVAGMRPRFDPDFGEMIDKHVAQGRAAPGGLRAAAWRAALASEPDMKAPPAS